MEEWTVIFWAAIVVFALAGVVGLYFSFGAAPEKLKLAQQLRSISYCFLGLAAVTFAAMKAAEYLLD
jgi:hypothetical protein